MPGFFHNDQWRGLCYCLISSIVYSGSLFLLRLMTDYQEVSTDWTLCVKELVTVTTVVPMILLLSLRGRYRWPSLKAWGLIVLAGISCEFVGARAHLQSYALIGLVLAAPLIQSFVILGTATVDTLFLKEQITRLKILAMILLIAAVILLSASPLFSPKGASPSVTSAKAEEGLPVENHPLAAVSDDTATLSNRPVLVEVAKPLEAVSAGTPSAFPIPGGWRLLFGALLTLVTGLGYTFHIALIRTQIRQSPPESASGSDTVTPRAALPVPISLIMVTVTGVGVLICGGFLLYERGPSGFIDVPRECWGIVIASGFLNMFGYYYQNKGVQLVSTSTVSLIAATQILFLTLLGIAFFHESANFGVWCGLALTVVGVTLAGLTK